MKKDNAVGRWLWWLSLAAAAVLIYKIADNFAGVTANIHSFISIFTPFIIGFVITFILYAPCNKLELLIKKSKFKFVQRSARVVSITVCYILFLALIAGILVLLLPALYDGISSFIKSLPTYYADVSEWISVCTAEGGVFDRLGLSETVTNAYNTIYEKLLSLANPGVLLTAFTGMFKGIMSVTSSLFDVLMAFIVSIYMLSQRESLLRAVKSLLGAVVSDKVLVACTQYTHKTASIFYRYLYGTSVDVIVVAVLMVIGLSLFRLPQSVLLGCMIGLMNFIPYFGAITGGAVAVLIALLTQNIYSAIGVLIYVVVIQQVDGNIIQPRIVGSSMGLRPIYVLLGITVGGGLFGFLGMLIGVPAIAVVKMLLTDFIAYRKRVKAEKTVEPEPTE